MGVILMVAVPACSAAHIHERSAHKEGAGHHFQQIHHVQSVTRVQSLLVRALAWPLTPSSTLGMHFCIAAHFREASCLAALTAF